MNQNELIRVILSVIYVNKLSACLLFVIIHYKLCEKRTKGFEIFKYLPRLALKIIILLLITNKLNLHATTSLALGVSSEES